MSGSLPGHPRRTKAHRPNGMLEPCYTVKQIAEMWAVHERTIRRWFEDYAGVLSVQAPQLLRNGKKPKRTLRIPKSVAEKFFKENSVGLVNK